MTEKELEVVHRLEAAGSQWIDVALKLENEGLHWTEIARIQQEAGHTTIYMGSERATWPFHPPDWAEWVPTPDEDWEETYQPEE